MNCPYCGEVVHDQAVLCVHCGKSLSEKAVSPSVGGAPSTLENAFEKLAGKVKTALTLLLINGVISLISTVFYEIVKIVEDEYYYDSVLYKIYEVATNILSPVTSIIYLLCLVIAISGVSVFVVELKNNKKM